MTVNELLVRFPEIPKDLADEPLVSEYAETFDDMLRMAQKPSPCINDRDAVHVFYTTLVQDMAIYGLRLAKRDKTLERLRARLEQYRKNPVAFGCGLVPGRSASAPPPGCPSG